MKDEKFRRFLLTRDVSLTEKNIQHKLLCIENILVLCSACALAFMKPCKGVPQGCFLGSSFVSLYSLISSRLPAWKDSLRRPNSRWRQFAREHLDFFRRHTERQGVKEKLPDKFEGLTFLGKLKNNPAPAEEEKPSSHQCHNVTVLPISSLWGRQTAFSSAALKRNTLITLHSQSQV